MATAANFGCSVNKRRTNKRGNCGPAVIASATQMSIEKKADGEILVFISVTSARALFKRQKNKMKIKENMEAIASG